MPDVPQVSVIVPFYNRENTLPEAIESLIQQTHQNWEAILIDDGSADSSLAVARRYAAVEPRIQILHQENKGVALARNLALTEIKAPWVTFLDSDDLYMPKHLAGVLSYLTTHTELDGVYGKVTVEGSQLVPDRFNPNRLVPISECVVTCSIWLKAAVFQKLQGFRNLPFAEDADLIDRAKLMYTIGKFDQPTFIYRRNVGDSLSKVRVEE